MLKINYHRSHYSRSAKSNKDQGIIVRLVYERKLQIEFMVPVNIEKQHYDN